MVVVTGAVAQAWVAWVAAEVVSAQTAAVAAVMAVKGARQAAAVAPEERSRGGAVVPEAGVEKATEVAVVVAMVVAD
mgnify:CR=1 FL=1